MGKKEKKILVIDDEVEVCKVVAKYLQNKGYECWIATSSKEALEIFGMEEPDVIITDIRIDDKSGMDILKFITKSYPLILIIVMTGYPNEYTLIDCKRNGCYDYFAKPFRLETLLSSIENAFSQLDRWRRAVGL